MSVPARRSRISSAMFGSWAMNALEMVPSASMARCPGCDLSCRGSRAQGLLCWFPVPRWCASGAAGHVAEPQSSASRVVCRCPEWPQAVSGVLKSAATLTNRSGEGASCCALRATSSKHGPRGPEADVGGGDESPLTNELKLRLSVRGVKGLQSFTSHSSPSSCLSKHARQGAEMRVVPQAEQAAISDSAGGYVFR